MAESNMESDGGTQAVDSHGPRRPTLAATGVQVNDAQPADPTQFRMVLISFLAAGTGLDVHPPARRQAAANTAFLTACGNAIKRKNIFGHTPASAHDRCKRTSSEIF